MEHTTITKPGGLNPKQELVLQIAADYGNDKGKIDWRRAWQDHPEWKLDLRYSKKDENCQGAYNIAQELRQKGLLKATPMVVKPKNRLAGLTPAPTGPGQGKGFRFIKPNVRKVLEIMLKHADAQGHLSTKVLDEKEPGWRDAMTASSFWSAVNRLKRTGRFAQERKLQAANEVPPAVKNGNGNGNGHPADVAEAPQPISEVELERLIQRRADECLDALIAEAGCCQKCGKSYVETLRMERVKQKAAARA